MTTYRPCFIIHALLKILLVFFNPRPGQSRFNAKWLKDIIESKVHLMQSITFWSLLFAVFMVVIELRVKKDKLA
jgi:ABC-type microcin C transport system permease subunit YejB